MKVKSNIIIIDDEKDLADNLQEILMMRNHTVDVAYNGEDCMKLCREKTYQIALIDILLPDISGNDLTNKIMRLSPDIECILITGNASLESAIEAVKQEGVISYETKPLNLDHIIALIEQILKRKKFEDTLKENEEQLHLLFEKMPIMIYAYNKKMQILTWNKECERVTGYCADEIINNSDATKLLFPDDACHELISGNKNHMDYYNLEVPISCKNGSFRTVIWASILNNFSIPGWSGWRIGMDITERKLAEEEKDRLYLELLDKNKELEQIVYVTSHDLRSPLVNIQGFIRETKTSIDKISSVIFDEPISDDAKNILLPIFYEDIPFSLKFIFSSISKMDSLLSGLLRISRLDRHTTNISQLNMNNIITQVLNAFEFQIIESNAKINIDKLPPCKGNEEQTNQVFSNIIDNALKYKSPTRQCIINISGKFRGDRVVYSIEDNCIGIAKDHHNKIFNIFHRLNPSSGSGEGLGLTIVRKILSKLGGKIWIKSEPDKGSTFYISLPK